MSESSVEKVVQALLVLSEDMGACVIAAVAVSLVGLGAIVAFKLAMRFLEFGGDPLSPKNNYPDY